MIKMFTVSFTSAMFNIEEARVKTYAEYRDHHGILPKMARVAIESHEAVALYGSYQTKTIWCYYCKDLGIRQKKCNGLAV